MTKRVLIPLADGFEEIETMTVIDVLRRAGVTVVTAGLHGGALNGAHQVRLLADIELNQAQEQEFDALVLVGGQPGVDNLRADPRVLDLLRTMSAKQKIIGAICAAPLVLRDAGLTPGLNLTSYPGIKNELPGSMYSEERVVTDRFYITSRSPGTAMEFALTLVEKIVSSAKARDLAREMLVVLPSAHC